MAATRLIAMHHLKGKTIKQCLKDRIEYSLNSVKTENGEVIITELQVEGRKRMSAIDFLRGINKDVLLGKIFE